MITQSNFYKNEIYLPNAKSDISEDVLSINSELNDFIIEYEEECLITCLGYLLAKEFMSNLDSTRENGLIVGADTKWDRLLNGHEYTNEDGNIVLIDFGSAADMDPVKAKNVFSFGSRVGLEDDSRVAVSPIYAAPETFVKWDKSPLEFDVFSVLFLVWCVFKVASQASNTNSFSTTR